MVVFFQREWALIALLTLCTLVYIAGITPSFSSDDYVHLLNNQATSAQEAFKVFLEPFGREYRPMVRISLWFNHLMGDTALSFKITNLILHLGCVLLLYILLVQIGISKATNLLATSIFALHPIHTTSVHFILGRTDLVATIFYLATLVSILWWNTKPAKGKYLLSVLLFTGTLASKEMAVTLPLLMLALLLIQSKKNTIQSEKQISSDIFGIVRQLWLFILLTVIYLAARLIQWSQMPDSVSVYTNYSLPHIINNYAQWFFALVYPFDLYVAQEWMISTPNTFFAGCASAFGLLFIGAFFLWRNNFSHLYRSPLLWLGAAWIAITLIPMSGGNPHRWYLYLPSAGFSIMLAAAWVSLPQTNKLFAGFIALLLVIYAAETTRQSYIWQTQHQRNEAFLKEFSALNLHKEKEIYFANIPFGYKSAFMFTHNSLHEAVLYRFGEAPTIRALSYLNMADSTTVTIEETENTIRFSLEPNAFEFFLWQADQRRFVNQESSTIYGLERILESLADNGKISRYAIRVTGDQKIPVYYFDGKNIYRFPAPTH